MGFGHLKGIWRLLTSDDAAACDLQTRVRDIVCCCVLQNILISFDGLLEDPSLRNPVFDHLTEAPETPRFNSGDVTTSARSAHDAKAVRDCLIAAVYKA